MKNFLVNVKEVWVQPVLVEAETKEEAIEAVAEGGGTYIEDRFRYSHTKDPDTWNVEEE